MISEPGTGITSRRQGAPPAGYMRAPRFSVTRMNATTTRPTTAPMMSVKKQQDVVFVKPKLNRLGPARRTGRRGSSR